MKCEISVQTRWSDNDSILHNTGYDYHFKLNYLFTFTSTHLPSTWDSSFLTQNTGVNIRGKASHHSGFSLHKHPAEAYEFEISYQKSPQYRLFPLFKIGFIQIALSYFSKHIYSHLGIVLNLWRGAFSSGDLSQRTRLRLRQRLENKIHHNSCHHRWAFALPAHSRRQ